MKLFRFFILSVAAVASVTSNGQTPSPAAAAGDLAAAQEIRGMVERWTKAFSAKDVDRVMELYTDDVVVYDVVPPLQYIGKAAYRGDYSSHSTTAIFMSRCAICTLGPVVSSVTRPDCKGSAALSSVAKNPTCGFGLRRFTAR